MKESELGWDAIDRTLAGLYGDQKPIHFGTVQRYAEGGSEPLDGISAYASAQPAHWHFVTFGLTELGGKESPVPDVSGWGFELTLRLPREAQSPEPPRWALVFLQKLARFVFNTGEPFSEGDYIDMGGTITGSNDTDLTALVFASDPQLPPIQTLNGSVAFLQAIGVTQAEYEWVLQHGVAAWVERFAQGNPLLVTEPGRQSTV